MIVSDTYRLPIAVLALALSLPFLAGCDDAPPPPPPKPASPAADNKPKPPMPVAKKIATVQEFKRKDWGSAPRDPFTFVPPAAKSKDEGEDRERGPLENFKVNSLKLVAIITGTSVPKAMFTDDTGFGHVAKEGDRIGTDGAIITAIRLNEVEITSDQSQVLGSDIDLEGETAGEAPEAQAVPIIIRLSDTDIEVDKGSATNEELVEELELDKKRKAAGNRSQPVQ